MMLGWTPWVLITLMLAVEPDDRIIGARIVITPMHTETQCRIRELKVIEHWKRFHVPMFARCKPYGVKV